MNQGFVILSFFSQLEIIYHSPYTAATTTRVIEPLRLEYRDEIPYLLAYCQRARAERTFRVARILRVEERIQVSRRNLDSRDGRARLSPRARAKIILTQ